MTLFLPPQKQGGQQRAPQVTDEVPGHHNEHAANRPVPRPIQLKSLFLLRVHVPVPFLSTPPAGSCFQYSTALIPVNRAVPVQLKIPEQTSWAAFLTESSPSQSLLFFKSLGGGDIQDFSHLGYHPQRYSRQLLAVICLAPAQKVLTASDIFPDTVPSAHRLRSDAQRTTFSSCLILQNTVYLLFCKLI